jgi:hypothetical protein
MWELYVDALRGMDLVIPPFYVAFQCLPLWGKLLGWDGMGWDGKWRL